MIEDLKITFTKDGVEYQYQYGTTYLKKKKGKIVYDDIELNKKEILDLKKELQKQLLLLLKETV